VFTAAYCVAFAHHLFQPGTSVAYDSFTEMSHKATVINLQKLFSVRALFFFLLSWDKFKVVTICWQQKETLGE